MTVIFSDFDAFSPLINCIVTHRKLKSRDQNFLWAKMQFFNGEIPTKSKNIMKECRSTVREEALYLTMLSAVTPTL